MVGGLHRAENHVARLRRAIIIKDVIAVFPIFGLVVFLDGSDDAQFFLGWQVQLLLDDAATLVGVSLTKFEEVLNAHHIVGLPENEAQHEIRLAHIENSVVHRHIDALFAILIANRRVTVKTVRFFTFLTRQQADGNRRIDVGGFFGGKFRLGKILCKHVRAATKNEQQNAKIKS